MGEMADLALEQMMDEDQWGFCGFDNLIYIEEEDALIGPNHQSPRNIEREIQRLIKQFEVVDANRTVT